jgi:hypothetical protein
MDRTSGINIMKGKVSLMTNCRTIPVVILILALLAGAGCTQPEKTPEQALANPGMNATPAPSVLSSPEPTGIPDPTPLSVISTTIIRPTERTTPPVPATQQPLPGGYIRYSGTDYSIEYPSGWSASGSTLPLYEYRHDIHGCNAVPAYNLNRELRAYSSPDGGIAFYSSIVSTDRDIWPRTLNSEIVYADIVNSVIGTLDTCANSPAGAFTIAGISQVPLDGVSYTGTRADYAKINSTGFTDGTGTAYVVTGREHSGIFLFYRSSPDAGMQPELSDYMFDSLQLNPGF